MDDFKICESVHHHTIEINHQLYAAISPVSLLDIFIITNLIHKFLVHLQKLH